jgi:hypothetical protein
MSVTSSASADLLGANFVVFERSLRQLSYRQLQLATAHELIHPSGSTWLTHPTLQLDPLLCLSSISHRESEQQTDASERLQSPDKDEPSKSSYRVWFRELAGSADVPIPGAPLVALRFIPTSKRLDPEGSPILLRARVAGVGSGWSGLDIAANF